MTAENHEQTPEATAQAPEPLQDAPQPAPTVERTPATPDAPQAPPKRPRGRPKRGEGPTVLNRDGTPITHGQIDAAMTQFGGDRAAASNMLGIDIATLSQKINHNKLLQAKWRTRRREIKTARALPPSEAETLSRDSIVPAIEIGGLPITVSDAEMADMVAREDAKIREGILEIGAATGDPAELAISLRRFEGRQIQSVCQMMTSGLVMNSLGLLAEIKRCHDMLERGEFQLNAKGEPAQERMIRESYKQLNEEYRRHFEAAIKGSLINAKIAALKADAMGGNGKVRTKPGFGRKVASSTTTNNIITEKVILTP